MNRPAGPRARARWRRLFHEAPTHRRDPLARLRIAATGAGRAAIPMAVACCGLAGLLLGGPVAGAVLATYGGMGTASALRRATRRAEASEAKAAMDAVAGLAAELRAGAYVPAALAAVAPALRQRSVAGNSAATVYRRLTSAVEVAESSGAPLADVLERLDAHLRAIDRARATVSAQAAGARASAFLLAAMPVAGVGLGFVIGVDSLHVLLSTPLGAACLVGSVALQLCGLAWTGRLVRVEVAA